MFTGILALSSAATLAKCRVRPDACDEAGTTRTIPVKIYRNFLVVAEGQIGGVAGPQNFILDTGTAPSIVNERVAKELGLESAPARLSAFSHSVAAETAVVSWVALGPIRAPSVSVHVLNLARLERDLGIPIAGILGLDVLSRSSFRLNYGKSELAFGEIERQGIPVVVDAHSNIAVAQVQLGQNSVRLLIDTGSDRVVLLGGNSARLATLALRNAPASATSPVDLAMHVQEFPAPDIVLGGEHFNKDRAYFVPGSADVAFDGLLGVRALGFRSLAYDQASGTMYLQK